MACGEFIWANYGLQKGSYYFGKLLYIELSEEKNFKNKRDINPRDPSFPSLRLAILCCRTVLETLASLTWFWSLPHCESIATNHAYWFFFEKENFGFEIVGSVSWQLPTILGRIDFQVMYKSCSLSYNESFGIGIDHRFGASCYPFWWCSLAQ